MPENLVAQMAIAVSLAVIIVKSLVSIDTHLEGDYFIGRNLTMQNAFAPGAASGLPMSLMATAVYIYEGRYLDIPRGLGYVYLPAWAGIVNTRIPVTTFGAHMAHRLNPKNLESVLLLCCVLLA